MNMASFVCCWSFPLRYWLLDWRVRFNKCCALDRHCESYICIGQSRAKTNCRKGEKGCGDEPEGEKTDARK